MDCAFVTGALGFVAYLVAVLVLLRVVKRTTAAFIVVAAAAGAGVVMILVAVLVCSTVRFWAVLASYSFLTVNFLMAFGAVYKSVSLRMLQELMRQPERADRYEAILERCVCQSSYQERLRVLIQEGFASEDHSGYQLTLKGRRLAGAAHLLHRLFRIERSG